MSAVILRAVGTVIREQVDATLRATGTMLKELREGVEVMFAELNTRNTELRTNLNELASTTDQALEVEREAREEQRRELLDSDAKIQGVMRGALSAEILRLEGVRESDLVMHEDQATNLVELISEAIEKAENGDQVLEAKQKDLQLEISAVVEDMPALMRSAFARARDWARGAPYKQNELVRHEAGVWIATKTTSQQPGCGDDWLLLLEGFKGFEVARTGELGRFHLRVKTTSGEKSYPLSVPTIRRTFDAWSSKRRHEYLDIVSTPTGSYLARRDNPRGNPTSSEDWLRLAANGPEGKRGPTGRSPSPGVIAKAYQDLLEEVPGAIIRAFRGRWEFSKDYRRGDVVAFEQNLLICLRDTPASASTPASREQRENWQVFARGVTGTSGGSQAVEISEIIGETGF